MYAVRTWIFCGLFIFVLTATPSHVRASSLPDTLKLNALEKLYQAVDFDHAKHIAIVKDCADCHHHTAGTLAQNPNCVKCHRNSGATANVACRGCHLVEPFSAAALRQKDKKAYHHDIMGLKGAYHQACSGCHQKMGGPTGCQDCHTRKKEGDAFYSSGAYAPPPQAKKKHHGE